MTFDHDRILAELDSPEATMLDGGEVDFLWWDEAFTDLAINLSETTSASNYITNLWTLDD